MATACYKEPYIAASFKGVAFKAKEATSEHGRRGAEGEFPFGESTAYADLGRKIRRYTIQGRFDGNNHVIQAALLIAACETTGPGILTHPTRGVILSAACTALKVSDKMEEEGGVTYVDLEFVEANEWGNGLSLLGQVFGLILTPLLSTSRSSFSSNYKVTNAQTFRRDAIVDSAQTQVANIVLEYAQATSAEATDASRSRIIHDLNSVVASDTLAADTTTMEKSLTLGMNAIALELSGAEKYEAFRHLANQATQSSPYVEPAATVQNAIWNHVRIAAAAYMVQGALEDTTSRTAIVFERLDAIDSLLTQEIEYTRSICDNLLFLALGEFRTEALAQLHAHAYTAPGLISYNFSGTVHPLVAAFSIYGDAKRHRDLENWNSVGLTGRMQSLVSAERNA